MLKNVSKFFFKSRINYTNYKFPIKFFPLFPNKFGNSKFFCEKIQKQKLLVDFKNILESEKDDNYDRRIKLLSLELLQKENSNEVLYLFEEYYLKSLVAKIYGEELALIIYFYITLMEKDFKMPDYKINDKRFDRLLELLQERIKELDVINLLAVCWALNIAITRFNLVLPVRYKIDIIDHLPDELPIEKHGEIPTICFSISNFLENKINKSEDEKYKALEGKAADKIMKYIGSDGLIYNSLLNITLMFICWTKIKYDDMNIIEKAIIEMRNQEIYFSIDNLEEILKILWACSILNIKSITLEEISHSYFEKNINELSLEKIIDGLLSLSSISPENINLVNVFLEGFKEKIRNKELVELDIVSYVNLFLGLSKFHLKNPAHKDLRLIISYLLNLYDKNNYLTVKNMDKDEICSLVISFSVLMVWESKIVDELLSYIKYNVQSFNNNQLLQLASSGKFIFSQDRYTELYKIIHDACILSKQSFSDNQIRILKKIYKDDGIITNSIFVN